MAHRDEQLAPGQISVKEELKDVDEKIFDSSSPSTPFHTIPNYETKTNIEFKEIKLNINQFIYEMENLRRFMDYLHVWIKQRKHNITTIWTLFAITKNVATVQKLDAAFGLAVALVVPLTMFAPAVGFGIMAVCSGIAVGFSLTRQSMAVMITNTIEKETDQNENLTLVRVLYAGKQKKKLTKLLRKLQNVSGISSKKFSQSALGNLEIRETKLTKKEACMEKVAAKKEGQLKERTDDKKILPMFEQTDSNIKIMSALLADTFDAINDVPGVSDGLQKRWGERMRSAAEEEDYATEYYRESQIHIKRRAQFSSL